MAETSYRVAHREDAAMTTEEPGTDPKPNWRDASSYAYTRHLTREAWAWEFLRRNSAYAKMAGSLSTPVSQVLQRTPVIILIDAVHRAGAAVAWGLHFRRRSAPRVRYCVCVLASRREFGRPPCRGFACPSQ